jgi:hypothetical protein
LRIRGGVRAGWLNLVDPAARRLRDRKRKRWERGAPMELLQMNVVGGFVLANDPLIVGPGRGCSVSLCAGSNGDHGRTLSWENPAERPSRLLASTGVIMRCGDVGALRSAHAGRGVGHHAG